MVAGTALDPYGWGPRWEALMAEEVERWDGAEPGRVVRHGRGLVAVACGEGVVTVPVRRTAGPIAVGDWVVLSGGRVATVLERSSLLRRADPAGGEQLLASNVDLVVIVAGLDRPVKPNRIRRAVSLAWDAGAIPLVVLTKRDLEPKALEVAAGVEVGNPGLEVVTVSAVHGVELERLAARLGEGTSVLLGESGAGKSTLLNALMGSDVAATGEVRAGDAKGRHTTTARELHLLPGGGAVIDTPGIRAVGLWADPDAVAAAFPDVDDIGGGCRFTDCAHATEPGCAVQAAVEAGELPRERLESWGVMRKEAEAAALRADEHARRSAGRRFARVARDAQHRKGPR